MHYVRFSFYNFKGLRDVTLKLAPDASDSTIVTLVGLNESGKTTILEAIDRFVAGKDDEEIKPKDLLGLNKQEPFDLIPIAYRGNFNDNIEIHATVRLDDHDKKLIKKQVQRKTGFRVETLPDEVEITNRYAFTNSKFTGSKTLWPVLLGDGYTPQGRKLHPIRSHTRRADWDAVVNAIRELAPRVWYFPNFLFEFPERVQLNESANETDTNRLFRFLIQDILRSIDDSTTLEEHIVKRALSSESSDRASLKQINLQVGAEVTNTVVSRWNEMFGGSELQGKRIFSRSTQTCPRRERSPGSSCSRTAVNSSPSANGPSAFDGSLFTCY